MGKPKKNRLKKVQPWSRKTISSTKLEKLLVTPCKKGWKVVIGLGVILSIVVGIKYLFFEDKSDKVIFEQPRFSEEVESFSFTLGESGIGVGYSKERLERETVEPYNFAEFKPVKLYIDKGVLYADVAIYGESGLPPIKIIRNVLSGKPKNWDFNSNEKAIEIVNSKGNPIYQFYYKTPSHIVVNGIFPFPNGFILAGPKGSTVIQNANVIAKYRLKPIFKYPSWKYPGEYADE